MSIRSPAFGSLALTVAATASQLKATPKAPADTPIRVNWPMLFEPITFGGLITNWQGYDMKWEYVVMKWHFFYDHSDLFQQVFHKAFNNRLKLQYRHKMMGSCNVVHRRISKICDTVSPFHRKRNLLFLNLQPFFQNRHRWYSKAHTPVQSYIVSTL